VIIVAIRVRFSITSTICFTLLVQITLFNIVFPDYSLSDTTDNSNMEVPTKQNKHKYFKNISKSQIKNSKSTSKRRKYILSDEEKSDSSITTFNVVTVKQSHKSESNRLNDKSNVYEFINGY